MSGSGFISPLQTLMMPMMKQTKAKMPQKRPMIQPRKGTFEAKLPAGEYSDDPRVGKESRALGSP